MLNKNFLSFIIVIIVFLLGYTVYADEIGTNITHIQPISVYGTEFYAIKNDHSLWKYEIDGDVGNLSIREIKILDNVVSVEDNYAIKTDGTLWAWGYNEFDSTDNLENNPYMPKKVMNNVVGI